MIASPLTAPEARNQALVLAVTTVLLALSYISFILRILSRRLRKAPLWIDDWVMLLALGLCTAISIINYLALHFGYGTHRERLLPDTYTSYRATLYFFYITSALGIVIVKVGILLFYWKVFPVPAFQRKVVIVGTIIAATGLSVFLGFLLQCAPISFFWTRTGAGHCISPKAFYISGGCLNIICDVLVLVLPLGQIYCLKSPIKQKIELALLFMLGAFVCITSIFRLLASNDLKPADATFTSIPGGLWSTAELHIGFLCANLPHTRPILLSWSKALSSIRSSNGHSPGTTSRLGRASYRSSAVDFIKSSSSFPKNLKKGVHERDQELGDSSDDLTRSRNSAISAFAQDFPLVRQDTAGIEVHTNIQQESIWVEDGVEKASPGGGRTAEHVSTRITAADEFPYRGK